MPLLCFQYVAMVSQWFHYRVAIVAVTVCLFLWAAFRFAMVEYDFLWFGYG